MTDRGVMTRDEEEADGAGPSAHAALRRSNRLRERQMPSPKVITAALSAGRRRTQERAALNRPAGTTPHERVSSAALVRHETIASQKLGSAKTTHHTTNRHRAAGLVRPSAEGESKEVEVKIEEKVAELGPPGHGNPHDAKTGTPTSPLPSSARGERGASRPTTNTTARDAVEIEVGAPGLATPRNDTPVRPPWLERAGAWGREARLRAMDIARGETGRPDRMPM